MKKTAYIFRGSPASGKGTLTREFMKKLPGKVAFLELDDFRWGYHFVNRKVKEVTVEEHKLAYNNFLAVLENYLRNGHYTIVVEGSFSWNTDSPHGNAQDVISLYIHYGFSYKSFLLTGKYETLWKRNRKRKYSVPEKEFKMLNSLANDKVGEDEIVVDVENNSTEKCAEFLEGEILK